MMKIEAIESELQETKREVSLLLEYIKRQRQQLESLSSDPGGNWRAERTTKYV